MSDYVEPVELTLRRIAAREADDAKAHIISALRRPTDLEDATTALLSVAGTPHPTEGASVTQDPRIAKLEAENRALRLHNFKLTSLCVAGVGLLSTGAPRELSAAHTEDVRTALSEAPR